MKILSEKDLWNFNTLPEKIRIELSDIHTHAELCDAEEIVYKEKDVIKLIKDIIESK